ncbi:MAG TPA: HNH endonuclease [Pseudolabrys sp.]
MRKPPKREKYDLQPSEVREMLDYDRETGVLKWSQSEKVRPQFRGTVAGTIQYDGYRCLRFKFHRYYAHVLIWFHVHGAWPREQIDHWDLNRDNNALANLRLATPRQNSVNTKVSKKNTSGFKGVCEQNGRWIAQMRQDGKRGYIGSFDTAEEAFEAYKQAALKQHGEFARPDG